LMRWAGDEVGRGALAGPLVVGAVILSTPIDGVCDSKILSRKQRTSLSKIIIQKADAHSLGWVSSKEIDRLGLTKAIRLAITRALKQIGAYSKPTVVDKIIIDGNYNFLSEDKRSRAIIKADVTVASVSAASIIAKVARDDWMINIASKRYPVYMFDHHVGYGTKKHLNALDKYGPCTIHRLNFKPIKNNRS